MVKQAFVWVQIAEYINTECANGVGRSDIAEVFGVCKMTATYHLDKAASRGYITRVYTWVSNKSRGWVYYPAQVGRDVSSDAL